MKETYDLETVLKTFEWLVVEKWVDKIIKKSIKKIFWNEINDENINEFKSFVRKFSALYNLMKEKFSKIYRKSWERYFEHLREVVNNVLDLPNPNINKVLIALAHDSIEDTNKTYEWLEEDYWYEVAIWVQAISKGEWEDYLTEDELNDLYSFKFWAVSKLKKHSHKYKEYKKYAEDLEKKCKERRNDDYFSHLESFEKLSEHINNIAIEKTWTWMNKRELKILTQDVLDVKLADRIHNLTTQWDPKDLDKTRRKIDETKKYFLKIAEKHSPEAYKKLQSLILTLEVKLHQTSQKVKNTIS